MKKLVIQALALLALVSFASERKYPKALVSFTDFKDLMAEVEPHRAERLVDLDTFLKMSLEEGTIIFDSRSDFRFDRIHIKGAKHLAFTDFTQESLAKVIPDPDTKILIYCNNNFTNNRRPVVTKALPLALNIQTFINLYGYGYKNVWELGEAVDMDDPRVGWVSAAT